MRRGARMIGACRRYVVPTTRSAGISSLSSAILCRILGCVRRQPSNQERHARIGAYLTGADDEQKGRVMVALFGRAVVFLLLTLAETIWVVCTAVRVWRRREGGLAPAAKARVHKPTLVILLAAHVIYEVLRMAGIAKLDRRSIED